MNTPTPLPNGEFAPHIIVLLTDGSNNAGPTPFNAANEAVARGIRVYTIGFGTVNNTSPMNCGDLFSESDQFGGPGFGLGFGVRTAMGQSEWMGTPGEFYWGGYAGTAFFIDPKERLVAVMMSQAPEKRQHYRNAFRANVYQAINE